MIITATVFYISLAVLAAVIYGVFLFIENKYDKEDFKRKSFFVIVPLGILIYMFCPKVYIIQNCTSSEEKVMVFPTQSFTYGNGKCYVINQSTEVLGIVTYVYGNPPEDEVEERSLNVEILPKATQMIPKGMISYLLQPAPRSVSTKSDYEFRHRLFCVSQEDEGDKTDGEDGAYSTE
ncbi:MAG: hypothetical protein KA796_01050 [Chryseobacterium sp.]|nr:hypothetical protein [Chryseobacterium sp.]MBP7498434.1 hypothetical protein [Chryseobacterium sp.]